MTRAGVRIICLAKFKNRSSDGLARALSMFQENAITKLSEGLGHVEDLGLTFEGKRHRGKCVARE
jgi:hypothetical protein